MRNATLIRGARQLLTLRGPSGPRRGANLRNLGIIQDGAVLVIDGVIREVGPSRRIENLALARGAQEIDASGRVVLPGFVDSHMQLVGSSLGRARPVHELPPRVLETTAQRAIEEAVRNGTTAMDAKSGLAATEAEQLKVLRVHAALRELPLTLTSTFVSSGRSLDLGLRLLPTIRRRKLAEFAEIHWEADAFASEQVCRYLTMVHELGLELKLNAGLHADCGAIEAAVSMEARSVDHLTEANERDAMELARSETLAVLAPGAIFQTRIGCSGVARTLIDHGAAIALATGYHPCECPSQSMQMAIALACRILQMTAAEAIAASTINAAHALRRADRIGSIECGKRADLIMLSISDYRELPCHFGVNLVDFVMSRGTVLVEKSEIHWAGLGWTGLESRALE